MPERRAGDMTRRERARRLRLRSGNWPIVSLLMWRWMVLYGSEVVDFAHERSTAERRARWFISKDGWTVQKWNSITIERAR